ncbi:MAG: hypothetical protein ACRDGJ_00535 [Candidatus Limnocylindria bacterium]
MSAIDSEAADRGTASGSGIDSTSIIESDLVDGGWYGLVASVVPRVIGGSGEAESGTSTTDLYPLAAVLAALAAGGAGWRIFAVRMPPLPTGIRLAAPVPPG